MSKVTQFISGRSGFKPRSPDTNSPKLVWFRRERKQSGLLFIPQSRNKLAQCYSIPQLKISSSCPAAVFRTEQNFAKSQFLLMPHLQYPDCVLIKDTASPFVLLPQGVWISCLSLLLSHILENSIFLGSCSIYLKMWRRTLPALLPLSPSFSSMVSFLSESSGFFNSLTYGAPVWLIVPTGLGGRQDYISMNVLPCIFCNFRAVRKPEEIFYTEANKRH